MWTYLSTIFLLLVVPAWASESSQDTTNDTSTQLQPCRELHDGTLGEGRSCVATVDSRESKNYIGLSVKSGEKYTFSVPGRQLWFDKGRVNVAPCGEPGSLIMKFFGVLKQSRGYDYFVLLGGLEGDDVVFDLCPQSPYTATEIKIPVKPKNNEEIPRPLYLYANDAYGFYGNNCGTIEVHITRGKTKWSGSFLDGGAYGPSGSEEQKRCQEPITSLRVNPALNENTGQPCN